MDKNHSQLPLPNLGVMQLSLYIADLWLVGQGVEWVKEPRMRRVWHLTFFSLLGAGFMKYCVGLFLHNTLAASPSATLVWRCFWVFASVWLLCLTSLEAYIYYRYLLMTGKDIKFINIIIFWCTWVLVFSTLYTSLYILRPQLYSYLNPPFIPKTTATVLGFLVNWRLLADFLLYSACITVTLSAPGLSSASSWVSALNLVEVLGNILLVCLVVATFVTKSGASRK